MSRVQTGELKLLDPEKRPMDEFELRRVLRKLDFHLMPIVILLYLLAFLDRGNVGNAKILGMVEDANLTGLRYNIKHHAEGGSTVEVACFCHSSLGKLTLVDVKRVFFVGLAESALSPGILFYLSTWYPRRYLAWRVGLFISAVVLAGAFSGLLAYGIERMDKLGGLHGWQWIFGLEGIVTVLVGLVAPFFIHDSIQNAKFLSISEKDYLQRAITLDAAEIATDLDRKFIWDAFKDYRIYLYSISFLGIMIPLYSLALFLPTLVHELGYKAVDAQLFSTPPYALACVCTLINAYLSDRLLLRTPFVIVAASIGIIGFIILLSSSSSTLCYIAMFFATSGVFSADAVFCTLFSTAFGGETKRAVSIAMINGVGNLGGVLASFVYIHPGSFRIGYIINIGCLVSTILLTAFMMWDAKRSNQRKSRQCESQELTIEQKGEWKNLGDQSPLFR
ncbi:major facilitator superfamily domain-containing protein [Rhodocollybia butyracea]|uniref:Major facilitator superfamily domain-containing protein n=1 Tax=Rhodocollybia butyracea TaxID=206335 RepID=A0A9P5PW99_9AGAR|nr:major facilitator superfamily domain-containing protein [Rhodocollybia butyracea]